MRQTNGAINMLLAQYRAVYRRAYYIGMATAYILGAVFISGPVYATEVPADGVLQNQTYDGPTTGVVHLNKNLTQANNITSTIDLSKQAQRLEIYTKEAKLSGTVNINGENKKFKLNLSGKDGSIHRGNLTGSNTGKLILGKNVSVDLVNGNFDLTSFKEVKSSDGASLNFGANANATISQEQLENFLVDKAQSVAKGKITLFNDQFKPNLTITQTQDQSINISNYVGANNKGKISGKGIINTDSSIIDKTVFDHSNKIILNTKKLVIGNDTQETNLKIGFENIKVSDDLEFQSKTNAALFKEQNIELNATDNKTHLVHSNNKKITLGVGGNLNFTDGNWNIDSDLQVNHGNLNVSANAKDHTTVVLDGKTLSFGPDAHGKIIVGGDSSKGQTTLDLSKATVQESQYSKVQVKDRGTLKIKNTEFEKLKKGTITLESGSDVKNAEATIEIVGGNITLVEDDFTDVTSTTMNQTAKKIGLKGTLKGDSITFSDKDADNNINLTKAQTGFDKSKTKFDFNDINFDADNASLESAIISANNSLSVGKDQNKGTLTLKNDATLNLNGKATSPSKVNAQKVEITQGTLNVDGTWDFQDADLYLANINGAKALNVKKDASLNNINKLHLNGGKSTVSDGDLSAKQIALNGDSTLDLANGATLTVVGTQNNNDLAFNNDQNKIKSTLGSKVTFGKDAASDLYDTNTDKFTEAGEKLVKNYVGDGSTTITLDFDENTYISNEELQNIAKKFANNQGFISFGKAQVGLPDIKDNTITWDDAKLYGKLQVTDERLEQVRVTGNKDQIEADKGIYGSFGSFDIDAKDPNNTTVNVYGNTILSNAKGNEDGKSFVSVNDKTANVDVKENISFTLKNGGEISDVRLNDKSQFVVLNTNDSNTTIKSLQGTGDSTFINGSVNITDGVNTKDLSLQDNTLNVKQDLVAKSLNAKNSNLNVDGKIALGNDTKHTFSTFEGSNVKTTSFDLKNHTLDLHDTSVYAKSINADKTSSINIGSKAPAIEPIDNKDVIPALPINPIEPKLGTSGRLFVEDANSLNANVNLDAGNSRASALVLGKNKNGINEIKSNVNVGANSVVAYGFDSADDLEKHLQDNFLQKANGSIDGNKALAVFNDVTKITDGKLTLNGVANPLEDRANTQNSTEGIVLGDNTSIVITDNALAAAKASKSNQGIIQATNGKITLDPNGSKNVEIVLTGNITANSLKDDFGNDIVLLGEGISIEGANEIKVIAANGMLTGTLKDGKVVDLKANVDAINRENYNTSTPVKEYIAKVLNDSNVKVNINDYLGNHGKDLEQASRFGLYGGALKASEIASRAQGDVLKGYIASSMAISAEHGELSSFFIKPHVVSSKNKDLEAEGQVYGNDINLYGATFGSGFSVTPNIKVGALASLGRGSAKGRDIASGIDNDFTYYGVGAFASFIRPNFSTTADVNYSHVKSDLNSELTNSNIRHFNANVDSSVLSMGLESAYSFKYKGLEFAPHGGIRYSQYKLSDYNVYADNNNFMSNKFNDMSVLSLPFGLSIGADVVNDVWVVRPNLDLGITFNLGDTKMEQVSNIVGVNPTMTLNTQVVDDVVLGVKAGLRAYSGNLAIGFDIGYQGSSNASDISLGAEANYLF